MLFIFLSILGMMAGAVALVVFLSALPFLLKRRVETNRFGPGSLTQSPFEAIVSGFSRSLDFRGRANRIDFWVFAVFIAVACGICLVTTIFLVIANRDHPIWLSGLPMLLIPLLAIPSLSMAVRRLHDVNRSGGWLLLLFVFGWFILLFWFFQPTLDDSSARIEVFE